MLTYSISKESKQPLYEQLYDKLRDDMLRGRLSGGEKLPSKRALAEHLGISKITVETAYAQLLAEGYIVSRERSGYFVAKLLPGILPEERIPRPRSSPEEPEPPASVSAQLFPYSVWARLMRGVILDKEANLLRPVPAAGIYGLRRAIADELRRDRGMNVRPEQVVIGAGAEYVYSLLAQFLGRDRIFAFEEPFHRTIYRAYTMNGAQVACVGMDGSGMLLEELRASGASVAHLSPSHHYPSGIVMPITRRREIDRWLSESPERFVIEDEYDSEFTFSGRMIPTMQSMDATGRVIFMNTFSKTIAPTLRISYMVLPEGLIGRWQERMGFYSCAVPSFEQLTLARFLDEGYYERHLRRMRKHYRQVRRQLMELLSAEPLRSFCAAAQPEAGLHFLLRLRTDADEPRLRNALREAGLNAPLLADHYRSDPPQSANGRIVIQYSNIEPETLKASLLRLMELLR